jgi:tetratricopeptide (TPR) repeat protein
MIAVLGWGVAQCRGADPQRRMMLAAATAGCAVFVVAAGIDWVWELPVIPVTFLLLAASIAATRASAPQAGERRIGLRLGLVGLSIAGLIAVAIPLASAASIRDSQDLVQSAQLGQALDAAATAKNIQPYAATPSLQEALIYEQAGDLRSAAAAAREATDDEPANWRNWIVLSRLQARNGNVAGAIAAYRHARDLNPRSPLFNQ